MKKYKEGLIMFKRLGDIWTKYKQNWVDKQAFKDLIKKIKDIFDTKKDL